MDRHMLSIDVPAPVGDEVIIVSVRTIRGQFMDARTTVSQRVFDEGPIRDVGDLLVRDLRRAQAVGEHAA